MSISTRAMTYLRTRSHPSRLLITCVLAALVLPMLPARPASALWSVTFRPTADSSVAEDRPSRNRGGETELRVRDAKKDQRSYLAFAVRGVSAPAKARLRLWVTDGGPDGGTVSLVRDAWQEGTISWANAPAAAQPQIAAVGRASGRGWVEVDLGQVVRGDGTYAFVLAGGADDGVTYGSRESGNPPQLVLAGGEQGGGVQAPPAGGGGTPTPTPAPTPAPPSRGGAGLWISPEELAARPMSGEAWERLKARADRGTGAANIADQDSSHDIETLAVALVAARTGDAGYRARAEQSLLSVIGTESNPDPHCGYSPGTARSLTIGRNLAAYVVAADVLGIRPGQHPAGDRFAGWVQKVRSTKNCPNTGSGSWTAGQEPGDTLSEAHDNSGSNGSAMAGASRIAAALYLGDTAEVERAWATFRRYSGDRSVGPDLGFNADGLTWAHDPANPVAVNPSGTTRNGHRIDGAIINDIGRGGAFTWPPGHTGYQWEGIQGYVAQAELLANAGYPAWEVQDRAPLRTVDFVAHLAFTDPGDGSWWGKSGWTVALVNHAYGTSYPVVPATGGRPMAWTDWTHP